MTTRFVGTGGFATIQAAVDAAAAGDTILIANGTYQEQVIVDGKDNLSFIGQSEAGVIITAPATLTVSATDNAGASVYGVVTLKNDADVVSFSKLTIDGQNEGAQVLDPSHYVGLAVINSAGTSIDHVHVTNVDSPDPTQTIYSVYVDLGRTTHATFGSFSMTDSVVDHIGKSGIVTHGAAVSLTNNTVLGDGATGQETQNGIVLYDATGDVSGNHVSNFIYTGATFSPAANLATGILALNDAGLSFNSNVISEVQDGIAVSGLVAPWVTTIDFSNGNTFSNSNPLFINADKDFLTYDYNTGLFGSSHPLAIIGTDGHDALAGAALADFIDGRGGTDLLGAWDGAADSGKGDDIYRVDSASDLVIENASEGVDKIESAAATYTLPANVENLTGLGSSPHVLIGNELQNIITGNGGNDLLEGGAESDHLVGGGGIDTASYEHAPGPVHVDLGSFGTLGDAAGDTYVDIQNIVGSAFNDQLTGDGNDNAILGDLGHDSIVGMDGNDTILGDGGNDTLTGNEGNDIILGGDGNDQIGGDAGNDILAGNAGDDTIWGGAGDDQIGGGADNDTLVGEAGNDTIWGEGGNDIINAGADNDIVLGGAGNDQIGGGTGNDILFGEGGNDTIWGEDGTDVIIGGTGNDVLIGGANADTFYFTNGDATDIITDFAPTGAEHDQIWFDHTDLTSFADVLAHATSDGSSTVITYHAGDTLTLNGVTTAQLTAGDFIFT